MPLIIVRNDITEMQVDAIVNSANPRPVIGGGVDKAIHKKAGSELLVARLKIGDIKTGKAAITPAYRLQAHYVIHTVGPVWRNGDHRERELLVECYTNSLQLALEHKCNSIAFPLISAGVYGCPAEIAIATATQAIRNFLLDHDMSVYLVVYNGDAFKISNTLFGEVQNYLNEMYVDESEGVGGKNRDISLLPAFLERPCEDAEVPERSSKKYQRIIRDAVVYSIKEEGHSKRSCSRSLRSRALEDILDDLDASFSEVLMRYIDDKGKTSPEVYKRANVDRKHFSKIRNNPAYQPSKTTALAFAIALELNIDETKDFIGRAGYALSHSSKSDIIVEFFIERKEYDIFTINEALFAFGQPVLGS